MDLEKFKKKPESGFQPFRPIPIDFQQTKDIDAKPFVFRNLTNEFHIDYPELLTKIKNALQGSVDKGANPMDKEANPMDKEANPMDKAVGEGPLAKPFGEGPAGEGEEPLAKKPFDKPLVSASIRKKGMENPLEQVKPNTGDYEKTVMAPPAIGVVQRIPQFDTLVLHGEALKERLPKNHIQINMATSPYYANNRKLFIEYIAEKLKPYAEKIRMAMETQGCDTRGKDATAFALMEHQAVVSDYLNLMTPYRGLLLYHGLGSGKTCTSIAIAEGMKSEREILLMTPASLNANFFSEIRKCGDPLYKRNQFWEFVPTQGNPDLVKTLSQALYLPEEYIMKKRGAWMVDVRKEPNYKQLKSDERIRIDDQVDHMIRGKYIDVNYNGLTSKKWKQLTNRGHNNPFHNRVVVVDEVHKFVSLIVNKLRVPNPGPSEAYKIYNWLLEAQNCRIVFLTGTPMINYPNEIAVLFNMLRGYIKEWEISLSPGHNLSAEIIQKRLESNGFLSFDLVRLGNDNKLRITRNPFGFIRELPSETKAKPAIKPPVPAKQTTVPAKQTPVPAKQPEQGNNLTKKTYGGRVPTNKTRSKISIPPAVKSKTILQPNEEQDIQFIQEDEDENKEQESLLNKEQESLLNKEQESLLNKEKETLQKNIENRIYQFTKDVEKMTKELETGKNIDSNSELVDPETGFVESESNEKNKSQNTIDDNVESVLTDSYYVEDSGYNDFRYDSNANPYPSSNLSERGMIGGSASGRIILDETGNLDDTAWTLALKNMLTQMGITVGNMKINQYKALPDTIKDFADKFIDIETESFKMRGMKNKVIFQKRILGLTSFFRSDREDLMPPLILSKGGKPYEEVLVDMSDYQYSKYSQVRTGEISQESRQRKKPKNVAEGQEDYFDKKSSYRQFSRAACNFVFPSDITRPYPETKEEKKGGGHEENDTMETIDEESILNPANGGAANTENGGAANTENGGATNPLPVINPIDNPLNETPTGDDVEDAIDEVDADDVLNKGSKEYQEAVSKALARLKAGFRTYLTKEGLKIHSPKFLRMIEQIDAHQGCQLVYSQYRSVEGIEIFRYALEANGYEPLKVFKDSASGQWDCSPLTRGKKRYLLFTGTESVEEKRYLLNIYNGAWSIGEITQPMLEKVSAINGNNIMGEVVNVFMITSSGAEGLSLMNTRVVHIMEPYWHWVRLEQVIGRARRICSHQDLPQNLRNVRVFIYQSQMSQEQRKRNRESEGSKQLEIMDASKQKLDETGQPLTLTTDQMLLEISLTKDEQNQTFLNAVKETAIDCVLYDTDSANPRHCFRFEKSSASGISFKPSLEEDLTEVPDKVVMRKKLEKIKYTDKEKGIKTYRLDRNNEEQTMSGRYILYDDDAYQQGNLKKIGKVLVITKDPETNKDKMHIENDK